MGCRPLFQLAACLIVSCLAVASSPPGAWAQDAAGGEAGRKNVLFLIADDLNCDLGCYGAPVATPHIDALARRGLRFDRAFCQFPLCSPSRTSLLTGRRPNATRILTNSGRTPEGKYRDAPHFRNFIPDTVTLPQLFRQHGYFVARVGKLYHYGVPGQIGTSGLDDDASWELVVNPAGRDKAEEHRIFSLTPGSYGGSLSWLATDGADAEQTDGLVATSAISLLEAKGDRPFFLAVGFYRPHTPYVAPRPWFDMYPPAEIGLPEQSVADMAREPIAAYASAKPEQDLMSDDQRRQAIGAYRAAISFMDAQVGRVLEALQRLGLAEKTIVVMTSDHGYHMHQHGLWQKMSLFENSARVPLIIAAPGAPAAGQTTAALAELVDLYPTLAELCQLPAPDYLDGQSLQPLLDDPQAKVKQHAFTQLLRGRFDGYSVRTEKWRFTTWEMGARGEQLYDMENDPGEMTNLAADPQHAELLAELRAVVKEYAGSGLIEPPAP